jgi:hypothetical protein
MRQPEMMGLWRNGHSMWILQRKNVDQRMIDKVEEEPPIVFSVLRKWQSSVTESSYNTARARSSFNQQRKQCYQISRSDSHVQFGAGIHFPRCQS